MIELVLKDSWQEVFDQAQEFRLKNLETEIFLGRKYCLKYMEK